MEIGESVLFQEAPISTSLGTLFDDVSFQTLPSEGLTAKRLTSTSAGKRTILASLLPSPWSHMDGGVAEHSNEHTNP